MRKTGDYDLNQLEFGDAVKQLAEWFFNKKKVDVWVGKKCAGCEFRVQQDNLQAEEKSGFRECWQKIPGI
ncbi:MAG: hypothetical protein U5K69_19705 [Balneolaceae bacterium]|nr:hypothetical protein [Balneolaceae bacterium]